MATTESYAQFYASYMASKVIVNSCVHVGIKAKQRIIAVWLCSSKASVSLKL